MHAQANRLMRRAAASRRSGSGTPAVPNSDPNVESIAADGWQIEYDAAEVPTEFDPLGNPKTVIIQRPGFLNGVATTVVDTALLMKRVRLPSPDQTTLTTDQVAASQTVFANDNISALGVVVNNSTRVYPVPQCTWGTIDSQIIDGGSIDLRLCVTHEFARHGKPVDSVEFIITDGSGGTSSLLVTNCVSIQHPQTGYYAPYFSGTVDISGLDDGFCTIDAKIYPWAGNVYQLSTNGITYPSTSMTTLTCINNSAGSYGRSFAHVNTTAGASPTASTDASTAALPANHFGSVESAIAAAIVVNNASNGRNNTSGVEIIFEDGVHELTDFVVQDHGDAAMVFRGNSSANKLTAIFQGKSFGNHSLNRFPGNLTIKDMTLRKNTASSGIWFTGRSDVNTTYRLNFHNVEFDLNGQSVYTAIFYKTGAQVYIDCSGDYFGQYGAYSNVNQSGTVIGCPNVNGNVSHNMIACKGSSIDNGMITDRSVLLVNRLPEQSKMIAFNYLSCGRSGSNTVNMQQAFNGTGYGIVGNIFEKYGAASASGNVFLWGDGTLDAIGSCVFHHNTAIGNRTNIVYQDSGTNTIYKYVNARGNITSQINCKGDLFGTASGARIGNWAYRHGTDNRQNTTRAQSAGGFTFEPVSWWGEVDPLGFVHPTSAVSLDLDFTNDQSHEAGQAGNGDYSLGASSVAGTLESIEVGYPSDLYGTAMPLDGSCRHGAVQ